MNEIRAKEEHRPLCGLCKKPFGLLIPETEGFYALYGHIACNRGVFEGWDETWHHVDNLLAYCYRFKDEDDNLNELINKLHEHKQSKGSQDD